MTKNYKPDLARLVKRIRKKSGLTWEGLANRVEDVSGHSVHQVTLYRIQEGKIQDPSYSLGKAIEYIHKHSGKQ